MERMERQARRITRTLLAAQAAGSAAFIAVAAVTSIVGVDLGGHAALAGLPAAVYLIGSALSAPGWSALGELRGRRAGLTLGLAAGVAGGALAAFAVQARSFPAFLASMALIGAANGAMQLGRFAAAEVHPPQGRGRALATVVLGGTVGAVFGPLLVGPSGALAAARGFAPLAGPYAAAFLLLALAAVTLAAGLRPDPRDLGRQLAQASPDPGLSAAPARPLAALLRLPAVRLAAGAMILGQAVMVMLMVIAALHMREHQHGLGDISLVMSSHTLGMFAFSAVSGRLADRWGRRPVIAAGATGLALACLAAPLSPAVLPIAVSLFLLGLGWNFCYVGGSTLLADQLTPAERARTQGVNELAVGLASAAGSMGSGLLFAAAGFTVMALVGAIAALVPLGLALRREAQPAPAGALAG